MTKRCHFCGQKHAPMFHRHAKRSLPKRINKMESMSTVTLTRYAHWFYDKGLIVADLIILQRLGVVV